MAQNQASFLWGGEMTTGRKETVLFLLGVGLLVAYLIYRSRGFFHDDAFITLRYAANWLAGHGPVWNPGERVEGFTHPLWLLLVTGLGGLGLDLITAARLLGYTHLAALIAVWIPAGAAPLLLLPVVTLYGLVLWSGGGLEVTGFTLWLVVGAWQTTVTDERIRAGMAASGSAAIAGLAFAAAALMRPEGTGVGLLALFWIALFRVWRTTGAMLVAFVTPLIVYLSFRLWFYGDFLPNSARAKIDGLPMWEQLNLAGEYLYRVRGEWLPVSVLVVLCLLYVRSWKGWLLCLLSGPVWAGLLLGGGDHMPGARLAVPAIVLCLYASAVVVRDRSSTDHPPVWLGLALIAITVWQAAPLLFEEPSFDPAAVYGKTTGRALQERLPAGALVAVATAGSTPYYASQLRFVDTLGINDAVISRRDVPLGVTRWQQVTGHRKGFGRYVLDRRPDVIIMGAAKGWLGETLRYWFLGDFELLMEPEFYASYTPYKVMIVLYSRREDRAVTTEIIVHLRNDSRQVAAMRETGIPLRHPFSAPPDPTRFPLESLPPAVQPQPVPLLRPVWAFREALSRARADESIR